MLGIWPGTICTNCKARPATTVWVGEGGALAFVHGGGMPWCRHCVLEAQLAHIRLLVAEMPAMELELADVIRKDMTP